VAEAGLRDRSRAFLSNSTFAAFRIPGYAALWVSYAAGAIGWTVSFVAVGWITLQLSDSSFAVALAFTARVLPALVLGIPFGAVVDRFDRRLTLVVVHLASFTVMLVVAGLAVAGLLGIAAILATSVILGSLDTLRGTANQSYAVDLAGTEGATNAIALGNLGGALIGSVGAVVGGVLLEAFGPGATFTLAAVPYFAAASMLLLSRRRGHAGRAAPRLVPGFRSSLTLIVRNRLVAVIAFAVIMGEMLGWATISLYPTFARDVLDVDAAGLGAMAAARSLGSVIGLLLIATVGLRGRGGKLLLAAGVAFGLGLAGFALSTVFLLSLALLVVIGAASSDFDTLGQSLLQQSVDDNERGASAGVWFFCTGFGPFGSLTLGAAATAFGGPVAMLVSGTALATIALGLTAVRRLRDVR
jgi:MFS family permease